MKLKFTQEHLKNLTKAGLFVCIVAIIVQLYPRENSFKYLFEKGKPWHYELVTASFDFPIYKSEEQIKQEQAEVLKDYTPYYSIDNTQGKKQQEKLIHENSYMPGKETTYLVRKFTDIYATGMMSTEQYNQLLNDNVEKINIIDEKRITHTSFVSELYTPKTAYESIIADAPGSDVQNNLKKYSLNRYLESNMVFDSITSISVRNDLLKNLSQTSGMVQAGERIIDRGEIVSEHTYRILTSLKIAYENRKTKIQQSTLTIVGEIVFVTIFVLLLFLYLHLFRPQIFKNLSHLLFITLLILLTTTLASMTLRFTQFSIYLVPFAWLPIIVRVFFDSRTALFAHLVSTAIISFMAPAPFEFIILQIAVGMTAVSSLKDMTQRAQLAQTALWIFGVYSIGYTAFTLVLEGDIAKLQWQPFVYFAVSSLMILLAYGLIYIFEKLFGLTSSITLMELTNVNSDLMMKFAEVAPGTFQHSLQVSNLATEAAKKLNANSLLVRTGALYHDIGKMAHPQFFTENQQGGKNPLLDMELEEAAQTIINHVTEGVKIAQKKGLPDTIINFIKTHHGTSKTRYFYNTFLNKYPDRTPNEAAFTYPGPLPNTKETAILMMADAVEARSRSLQEYTEETIDNMVEDMINAQIADGMFKETPITFRDMEIVKSVFKEKIKSMFHHRIAYPKVKEA